MDISRLQFSEIISQVDSNFANLPEGSANNGSIVSNDPYLF